MDLHEYRRAAVAWLRARAAVDRDSAHGRFDPRRLPDWAVGILLVAVPSQTVAVWRVVGDLPPGTRPPLLDSLIFEYVGWYLTRGARLYVDVWELKPPLPYVVTAVTSLLAGGDPVSGHWLNVGLTAGAAVATAVVAGALVDDLTGDGAAAFAAGVSLYVLPAYHWRAAFGFKVKYFVALFALLSILLARRDRPAIAGAVAGAAVGFWQLAGVVPVLVAGVAYQRAGRRGVDRAIGGTVGVLLVALVPVLAWGALEATVTETVLVPLLVAGEIVPEAPLELARVVFGGALPVAVLGAIGAVVGARVRPRATWWLAAGAAWFGLLAVVIDLDAAPDLFPAMAFLAVGVGLLLGLEAGRQRPAAALLAVTAVVSVATMGGFGIGGPTVVEPDPLRYEADLDPTVPYSPGERAHLYWNRDRPETCRVFFGTTQYVLVETTGQPAIPTTCGRAEPVIDALVEQLTDRRLPAALA